MTSALDTIMQDCAAAGRKTIERFAERMALDENRGELVRWLKCEPFGDLAAVPTFPAYVQSAARWLEAEPLNPDASALLLESLRQSLGLAQGELRHLYTNLALDEHHRAIAAVENVRAKQKASVEAQKGMGAFLGSLGPDGRD